MGRLDAVRARDRHELTAYYTAAGVRGESERKTFRQRIFTARASIECVDGLPRLSGWSDHTEPVIADGA